jgi:hypothetical protein
MNRTAAGKSHIDNVTSSLYTVIRQLRGVAQLVEQRSPKPRAAGSSPVSPAKVRKNPIQASYKL